MNKIYNDNCFNVFHEIEQNSINMVLVDLPYGQTACEWDVKIDLIEMWKQLKIICKDNCQYVFFTTTKFGIELINSNPKWFKYDIVWEKYNSVGFFNANRMPLRVHEMIYIFNNPNASDKIYNPQKTPGKPYKVKGHALKNPLIYGNKTVPTNENETGDRHPLSVIKFHQSGDKVHPTQKPLELCEWLIKTYSNENDNVLDFCMGSGTTVIACINTQRNYIGIEMNNDIFKIAEKRINKN